MAKRFKDAWEMNQYGASNPAGVAKSLHEACIEWLNEPQRGLRDPAIELIMYHLGHLTGVPVKLSMDWDDMMRDCRRISEEQGVSVSVPKPVPAIDS